ncbi:MAG: DUF58 domain-containing protein [Candidatus Hydrogenedens sp.]|nr:DUF58 domain-containing protein [Candidatus Hydrogenedens sp.]
MNPGWMARLYAIALHRGLLTRFVVYLWSERLTDAGRMLIVAGVILGAFSLYSLLLLLFFLGFVSVVANALYRPRVALSVHVPEKTIAGGRLTCTAVLTNVGLRNAYDMGIAWTRLPRALRSGAPPEAVPVLEPGAQARFSYTIACPHRGVYALPALRAVTLYPFAIARHPRDHGHMQTVAVLPAYTPLTEVNIDISPRYQPGGISLTSHVGESPEYLGNRPYRPGDALRHIDHRAWARLGEPAVREFQEEYYCRLLLVVDTQVSRRWGRRRDAELEAVLSLTAALTDYLSKGEFVIDIVLAGASVYRLRTGRHTGQLDQVLEILAAVEPATADPFGAANEALADSLAQMSAVVMVLSRWSDSRQALVSLARDAGCAVKAVVVSDDAQAAAAAESADARVTAVTPEQVRAGQVYRL